MRGCCNNPEATAGTIVKYGEEIAVWIQLPDGETSSEDEIKAFCKGKIVHYKIPRHIKFVDEYPRRIHASPVYLTEAGFLSMAPRYLPGTKRHIFSTSSSKSWLPWLL